MADSEPLLSVIITSYAKSRLPDVFDLLESLKAQTYGHIEIVFVGEREPELCEQVKDYADQQGRSVIVLFNDGEPGLSAARNVGIERAQGDIIAFVDDDVTLSHEWAEEVINAFAHDSIIGITGPAYPLWEDPSMSWLPEELYWLISCTDWSGWNQVREVRNAWGMNMAFQREAFAVAGLFHNATGYHAGPFAEDNEFSLRVRIETGKRILYVPSAKVGHRVYQYRLSWSFVRERAYWIGRSRRNLSRVYAAGKSGGNLLSPERDLLGRIITRRIPRDLAGLLRSPSLAWRRLSITFWALAFVALGYYSHVLPGRNRVVAPRGSKRGET